MDLGIFQMAQLGGAGSYPWREYSGDTKELQEETNTDLRKFGYATIGEDGVLGPATCGAIKHLKTEHKVDTDWPDTCQGFAAPTKPLPPSSAAPRPLPYAPRNRFPWVPVVAVASGIAFAGGIVWLGRRKGWF